MNERKGKGNKSECLIGLRVPPKEETVDRHTCKWKWGAQLLRGAEGPQVLLGSGDNLGPELIFSFGWRLKWAIKSDDRRSKDR